MTDSNKSVLRRKITGTSRLPKEISRLLPLWHQFGEMCGAHLQGTSTLLLSQCEIDQKAVTLTDLVASWPETTLAFPVIDQSTTPIGFICLPETTGLPLALDALGQIDLPDTPPLANIYDVFILMPLVALMLKDLEGCLQEQTDVATFCPISLTTPILHSKELKRQKLPETLLQIDLILCDPETNEHRSLSLFLSLALATKIAEQLPEASENYDVDEETVEKLRSFLINTPISISAELDQFTLSVGECCRLSVDDVLPLPDTSLDQVQIKAQTVDDEALLSTGQLGITRQQKSVKLHSRFCEEFFGSIEILYSTTH
ncbi:MAG: FliM/FliN family flagellar motor switch protein [Parvularculaceae bacterium]